MVRSMVAGIAGLRTHQSKLDTIGNNIANVNTWGFKAASFHFKDSMYSTSIAGSAGSIMGGAAGGRNASQVGYGTTTSSITTEFQKGAPSPSNNPMDCMIDGTGFFLVGNMVNGTFTNVADSGLNLSRVGIFRVDGNGYLVDDQKSYVYGYGLVDGTGIPEKPAVKSEIEINKAEVKIDDTVTPKTITIGGYTVPTTRSDFQGQLQDWVANVTKKADGATDGTGKLYPYNISLIDYTDTTDATGTTRTVDLKLTAKQAGTDNGTGGTDIQIEIMTANAWGTGVTPSVTVIGSERVQGVPAKYSDELSAIRIPIDPDTGAQYEIQSYKINDDGTIIGIDTLNRTIAIAQLALITVENPNGLEKTDGYYYTIGPNAGDTMAIKPNGGPAGTIMGNYLEMANVDLASEFSQMITTQRGYQANSKIITVTDQMLEELVNMKR